MRHVCVCGFAPPTHSTVVTSSAPCAEEKGMVTAGVSFAQYRSRRKRGRRASSSADISATISRDEAEVPRGAVTLLIFAASDASPAGRVDTGRFFDFLKFVVLHPPKSDAHAMNRSIVTAIDALRRLLACAMAIEKHTTTLSRTREITRHAAPGNGRHYGCRKWRFTKQARLVNRRVITRQLPDSTFTPLPSPKICHWE